MMSFFSIWRIYNGVFGGWKPSRIASLFIDHYEKASSEMTGPFYIRNIDDFRPECQRLVRQSDRISLHEPLLRRLIRNDELFFNLAKI
ncbi:hypothetical protein VFDL14_14855 [Vibrio fortis]|uniref:Uncharacterized protein n=1 Tax=Vibrio fortis TaxID=212667 RepID=A0A066UNS8_9VIBR|nr:hypothetical protein VFDL14_14855 [Vibrio fortis]